MEWNDRGFDEESCRREQESADDQIIMFEPRLSAICARLRAPVRAYSSAIPLSTRKPPIVLVTAKLAAPCSDSHSSVLYPHNANAEALISSKKTNMLKASPGKLNPHIAARNMSTSTWYKAPADSKYCVENTSAVRVIRLQSVAMPAPTGSTTKQIPRAIPFRGRQLPNQ